MSDGLTHVLVDSRDKEYTTGCGLSIPSRKFPSNLTGWSSKVTCPYCAHRIHIHRKVEVSTPQPFQGLDDRTLVKRFAFEGKHLSFRWQPDTPWLYVYQSRESPIPMYAVSVKGLQDPVYAEVQEKAKQILREKSDCVGLSMGDAIRTHLGAPTLANAPPAPSRAAPAPRVAPIGPHCDRCLKPDEGDCVESPADPAKLRCMTCYIKGV